MSTKKLKNLFYLCVIPLTLTFSCCTDKQDNAWEDLIKDESLSGWKILNGEAEYTCKDGMIVGKTLLNTPNTFLCTEKMYGDFILELEFKVDDKLNSGVQIRSNSVPHYRDGRVHGYQIEIDPSERSWSAGIYDEARRGWIYKLDNNEPARNAFKNGEWNKYRIEAIGDTIQTWINGVPAANVIDNMTGEGFIGLQVHSIGNDTSKAGVEVAWRNIKIMTGPEAIAKANMKSNIEQKVYLYNVLTEAEKEEGWELLFDGESTDKWRGVYKEMFPEKGWVVHNAALTVLESGGAEAQHGGDIVTREEYADFELKLEAKLTEGANSGIKYYVTENEKEKNEGSAFGLEFQILDDANHPDADKGMDGNRKIGSLYDMIPAKDKVVKPVGEWNQVRLVSVDNNVEHWLNGKKVVEYERGGDYFRKMVARSKYSGEQYKAYGGPFGEAEKGHILLQDHGNRVSFRNIKIKEHE